MNKIDNFSEWYQEVIEKAGLAEHSAVKGCMVIKPYGYAIWESMQKFLDQMFKDSGHKNAYFPIFIPKSFFTKEASHVEGFAKECAVVTHYRLKKEGEEIVVDENAKLEEELIVRPTSETIIWDTYKKWIQSYRDLPILINQWANVVRWEMRSRLFLRTNEFLWQEGHTAHATKEEAVDESVNMIDIYERFLKEYLAIYVLKGIKPAHERFAGALETYCVEAMLQDKKAIQSATSHFLGQNFAKAFDVKFCDKDGEIKYVWSTSWGASTRLIGTLILGHGDQKGLQLPPKIAPIQVVIVPIYKNSDELETLASYASDIQTRLKGIRVNFDDRDNYRPGYKFADWEMKGVPLRITIGMREVKDNLIEVAKRNDGRRLKISIEQLDSQIPTLLDEIQVEMYERNRAFLQENLRAARSYEDLKEQLKKGNCFLRAFWDGKEEDAKRIQQETQATIRCILPNTKEESGHCISTNKETKQIVVFARAY